MNDRGGTRRCWRTSAPMMRSCRALWGGCRTQVGGGASGGGALPHMWGSAPEVWGGGTPEVWVCPRSVGQRDPISVSLPHKCGSAP